MSWAVSRIRVGPTHCDPCPGGSSGCHRRRSRVRVPHQCEILGHPGLSIDAGFDYQRGATQGYKVTLNGDAQVGGQVTLGSAFVTYDSSDGGARVSFGGQIGGSSGPVQAQLNVSGDINAQHIEAIGDAQLSAYGEGVSGRGVISDAGFGACGTLNVLLYHGDIGFKHQFSTGETDFDGCDFSGLYSQQNLTIADTGSRSVYFIIKHPAAGAWTMAPGSSGPPPVRFERADPWLNPDIRARVRSRGAQQTLGWRLRFQPGQTVSFLEQGPAVDHTLTGAVAPRGRVTFRPTAGPDGIRRIVALVEKDGFIRERLTIATFRARSPRRPRPSTASYRIHRGQLLLRWRPTDRAGGYEADVTLAHASMLRIAAAAGQQQVRVTLPADARVRRVTVAAVYAGRIGPAVIATER